MSQSALPPTLSDTLPANPHGNKYERVLSNAWKRFNDYDRQADQLKKRYTGFRQAIILSSFLITLLAVIYATLPKNIGPEIPGALKLLLVVLPPLSAAM